jgi:hypothetical protein
MQNQTRNNSAKFVFSFLVDINSNREGSYDFWRDNIVNIPQPAFQDRNLHVKTIDACRILYCVRKMTLLEMCVNENYIQKLVSDLLI